MAKCSCSTPPEKQTPEEPIKYYCAQCNAIKEAKPGEPRPECCGKKMMEVD